MTNQESRDGLQAYGEERWDAAKLADRIDAVVAWAATQGVSLLCGELGSYRPVAPAEARGRWLRDVRTILEDRGIPWALWEYKGGFGIKTFAGEVDEIAVQALGLARTAVTTDRH
jgi:endoglucanase